MEGLHGGAARVGLAPFHTATAHVFEAGNAAWASDATNDSRF